ncbi:MAG: beta-galactosidase [Chthonomonadales bacterium]|nr:beta-galactosidase [Chthonomonadales bacterium]
MVSRVLRALLPAAALAALGGAPPRLPAAPRVEPPVGWCAFYPSVDVGTDALPRSGASMLSVCAGGWGMAQQPDRFDFAALDRQIAFAEQAGLRLALIQELNPVYTPEWLRARARAAGECVRNANGEPGSIPSISSAIFARRQEQVVRATVEHLRQADPRRVVAWYHPGAEWWFPMGERYHPDDVARFRRWLRARYRSVGRLNASWGAAFPSFDAVPAPALDMMGGGRGRTDWATVVALDRGAQHVSWSTPAAIDAAAKPAADTFAAVTPGREYTVSAWAKLAGVRGYGAFIEVAWVRASGGAPFLLDDGMPVRGTRGWTRLHARFRAPKEAARAWVLLKVMGSGSVRFDDVEMREGAAGPNLAPNPRMESGDGEPAAWRFQNWSAGRAVRSAYLREGGRSGACLRVEIPEGGAAPYRNADAAAHDWSVFWYEAAADYINGLSALVKRLDPTRPTVTYLTMSWAFPAEWDETQRSAIAPDEVAMRGSAIDVFGMQLCSADGDPYRVTAVLDLMRKYGKPLWAVDLVDFTSGVHVGARVLGRVTQAAVQHGARGIVYCAWHIPTVLDYSFYPYVPLPETQRMLRDARSAIRRLDGLRVDPEGAILQPILPASPNDGQGFKNDPRSFMGWYRLLEEGHRTFDVVTARELTRGRAPLDGYRWVLAPDCAYLPRAALARLAAYARAGGVVVWAGRAPRRDEAARLLPAVAAAFPARRLPDLGRAYAGTPVRDTHAGNTPPLFLWRPDTATTRAAGSRARAALRRLLPGAERVGVALAGAGTGVRAVAYRGDGERAIHLAVAPNSKLPAGGVRLRFDARPRRLTVWADGVSLTPEWRGREVALPAFDSACIVRWRSPRASAAALAGRAR